MHCEGPGVADWFKESTITTRSLYSFNLLKCSLLQPAEKSTWTVVLIGSELVQQW